MNKKLIRLTEQELHRVISDSVYQILEQNVNEGWKNWAMAGALGAASMFANPNAANAQNPIVDDLRDSTEVVGKKYNELLLDPNKSIKENYAKIDSLMSLHEENNYAEYTIMVEGHYTNKWNDSYDWNIGMIQVKGKDNERHYTISSQIINILTELYAHSLDTPFNVNDDEYHVLKVNQEKTKAPTGREYRDQNGKVSQEYVEKVNEYSGNRLYCLYKSSPLYKKIQNKVIEETGLKQGGPLYDLEKRVETMQSDRVKFNNKMDSLLHRNNVPQQETPNKPKKKSKYDDMYL